MKGIILPLQSFQAPPFAGATTWELGVWILLTVYCAKHGTDGRIEDCRDWPEGRWLYEVGDEMEELKAESDFWRWDGKSLVVLPIVEARGGGR